MRVTPKITTFQFYTMLFLGRVFSLVVYIFNIRTGLSSEAMLLETVCMGAFLIITSLPTVWLLKKDQESSIITRASCVSKTFSKALCVIYLFDFYIYAVITSGRFELFTSSVMFPETNMSLVLLTLLAAAAYSAFKGIEAIGRSGIVFLVPVLGAFAFVYLANIQNFDTLNFTPIMTKEVPDAVSIGLYSCSRTVEILAVSVMLPFVKGNKKRGLPIWILLITLTILITNIMLEGVLGEYNKTQLFGMYTLAQLAEFEFIERLDALISCVWMLCAVIKLAFSFFVCDVLLTQLFGKKNKLLYLVISIAVIFTGTKLIAGNILIFSEVVTSPTTIILYLITALVVPISVIIAEKIKERKTADEKA